jgi:AhpD family alkylhydroperoxidase
MRRIAQKAGLLAAAVGLAGAVTISTGVAQEPDATYRDIETTLGSVPTMFKAMDPSGIAGAWTEFKAVQLNPNTALSGKEKELIGLAVAAQIPCTYCIYFHTQAARLNGASDAEIREAVAMAAISRHWSTVLNGMQVDQAQFRQETDAVLRLAAERSKASTAQK